MKIAFVYGNLERGGAQRVMSVLANYFVSHGDQVEILTLDDAQPGYFLDSRIGLTGLGVTGDSRTSLDTIKRLTATLKGMRRWEREKKPDAVLLFSNRLCFEYILATAFMIKPSKIICSERAHPGMRRPSLGIMLENMLLPRANGFIFQTERVKKYFHKSLRSKGAVIHNGLFSEEIPREITDFDRREHNRICCVGRLENMQKAVDVLIRAFALFRERHPQYILDIYGSGSDEEMLKELSRELNVESYVNFNGNVPNAVERIKDAGMFVLASRFEGMPNVLLEAMGCGLPCVSTDCDFGPAELIEDGVNGLLVPVGDEKAIAEAMGKIADDEELARRLSRGAAEIRRTHSLDAIAGQYRDYIEKVVKG